MFEEERQYYREDLTERDYSLENTTPHRLILRGYVIGENAWGNLLVRAADLLLALCPEKEDGIMEFHCPWTNAVMVLHAPKTSYKPFCGGKYYLNCNHTALHSCWALQDLLDFFGEDKAAAELLIHRPCARNRRSLRRILQTASGAISFPMSQRFRAGIPRTRKRCSSILTSISIPS